MNHTMKLIAAAALIGVSAVPARAQTADPVAPPRLKTDSGFYLGAGGGRARGSFGCTATCDHDDTAWHGYGGYQFNRFLAAEVGYSDFGTIESVGSIFGGNASARVDTTAWEIAGLAMAPVTDKFSLFLKLGMFRYDSDAVLTGTVVGRSNAKGTEYTIGLGMQYSITDYLGARLDWQRYNNVGSGTPGLEKDDIKVWRVSGRLKF